MIDIFMITILIALVKLGNIDGKTGCNKHDRNENSGEDSQVAAPVPAELRYRLSEFLIGPHRLSPFGTVPLRMTNTMQFACQSPILSPSVTAPETQTPNCGACR